jgi:hypothetical protein
MGMGFVVLAIGIIRVIGEMDFRWFLVLGFRRAGLGRRRVRRI